MTESCSQGTDNASVKLMIESIPSGVVLCTAGVLLINQRADELLGGSEEFPEVFQENLSRLFALKTSLRPSANATEPSPHAEIWFQRSDGRQQLCEVTLPNNAEQELWL
ncbi:MAG: hypothetical protein KDA77_10965, partial [Planctomycetaceae bacterium]|nr:hypothetical protein [Planctomycetaceae bacterium]